MGAATSVHSRKLGGEVGGEVGGGRSLGHLPSILLFQKPVGPLDK